MFCNGCGQPVPPDARFCSRCGAAAATTPLGTAPRIAPAVAVAILLAIGAVVVGISRDSGKSEGRTVGAADAKTKVTYRVAGGGGQVSLTYHNASGGTEQNTVSVPWELDFQAPIGTFVSLSAQKEDDSGRVIAKIYVNGDLLQQAGSSMPFGIVSVSGVVNSSGGHFNSLTPAQHLEQAVALKGMDWDEAVRHIDAIPSNTPESTQAKALGHQLVNEGLRSSISSLVERTLKKNDYLVTVSEQQDQLTVTGDSVEDAGARQRILAFIRAPGDTKLCRIGFRAVRLGKEVHSLNCE